MNTLLGKLGRTALDLLFPPRYFGCSKYESFLCEPCRSSLSAVEPPFCRVCAQPDPSGSLCAECAVDRPPIYGIRSPYLMEGAIREGIHALKYSNLRAAAPELGLLLARWLESSPVPGDFLVPVPLHKRRLRQRGYNQSALLAKVVGLLTDLPVLESVLVRTRDSPPQVSLPTREDRARNVAGRFACAGEVRGGRFILVDDVVTTGSTMSACAAALLEGGARSVWGLSLARQRLGSP